MFANALRDRVRTTRSLFRSRTSYGERQGHPHFTVVRGY
jgi:hypothetical protein